MISNDKYSKLMDAIIKIADVMERPNRWYAVGEYEQLISSFDEYLNYNVNGFENFNFGSKLIDTGFNKITVPAYFVESIDTENPYILWIIGNMGEINYTLKNAINMKEAILNNQGIISFSIRIGNSIIFKKKYANDEVLCKEEYVPDEIIRVDIFDSNQIINTTTDKVFENCKLEPQSSFKFSRYWEEILLLRRIFVRKIESNKYEVYTTDCDSRPESKEIIEGESLYSAYYDYMIQNGYFKLPYQKVKTKSKRT